MSARATAIADDPIAADAAEELLLSGGSALGAALAGYFAAAGAHSGVLLSPLSLLLGGVGIGARAFDGRPRQPGLGTRRPRGFQKAEAVPDAARVAVPVAAAAVLVAAGYDEQLRIGRILKAGIRRARRAGADARVDLLTRFRAVGAQALTEPAFTRPLLHVAGESHGGLVTLTDLRTVPEVDCSATRMKAAGETFLITPWAREAVEEPSGLGTGHAVLAVDARGAFVALSYRRVLDGVPIDGLELEAPPLAKPVMRGVQRAAPGAPLSAPAPIALRVDSSGNPVEALAFPRALRLEPKHLRQPALSVRRDQRTGAVQAAAAP